MFGGQVKSDSQLLPFVASYEPTMHSLHYEFSHVLYWECHAALSYTSILLFYVVLAQLSINFFHRYFYAFSKHRRFKLSRLFRHRYLTSEPVRRLNIYALGVPPTQCSGRTLGRTQPTGGLDSCSGSIGNNVSLDYDQEEKKTWDVGKTYSKVFSVQT